MKLKLFFLFTTVSSLTFSQQITDSISSDKNVLQEVSVVGSRNKNRTVVKSTVPIDVINVQEVSKATGRVEINQLLQFSAPSFTI